MSRRAHPFGSIAVKLSTILIAMGSMTGAAIVVAAVVFGSLAGSVDRMTRDVLPHIGTSLGVIEALGNARTGLARLADAESGSEVEAVTLHMTKVEEGLRSAVDKLPAAARSEVRPLIAGFEQAVGRLTAAEAARFAAQALLARQVDDFTELSVEARNHLTEFSDTALFDLSIGGEKTVQSVTETLTALVERDFATMRQVLEVRAELNLVTGIALAMVDNSDRAFATILRDSLVGSLNRLSGLTTDLAGNDRLAGRFEAIARTAEELALLAKTGFAARPGLKEGLLRMRQSSDADLSAILDDLTFELTIQASDAAGANETAIRALLDADVGRIRTAADLDNAVKSLFIAALLGASVDSLAAIDGAQAGLAETARHLADLAANSATGAELDALVARIGTIADPETGIVHARRAWLGSRDLARARAREAGERLSDISKAARDQASRAMQDIAAAGGALLAETQAAQDRMRGIAMVSLTILLVAPVATWLLILRPMQRVTRVTERLSQGDLAPVTGFERTGGEVGRMAAALAVFRDGMIARQEMERNERQRQDAAREADRRAAEADFRRQEAERAAEADRAAKMRQLEETEAARRAEMQRAAEAEREARAVEQAAVVAALAEAMDALAAGNLTHEITAEFPEGYLTLKRDFNAAVHSLGQVIRELSGSAELVDASSQELASAAGDLAQRTERSAVTLEQTAAAVTELASSSQDTAMRTDEVDRLTQSARAVAEKSNSVVHGAVETMSEIGASSASISKIVDLIETIAFQTNLLALNAGVEAARAGEQGRGFAVVANEVRALAQRSSEAAMEINELITRTQGQIGRGVDQVSEAGQALGRIIEMVQDVSGQVSGLSVASSEQAKVIAEIQTALEQLDRTTQQNAAMFEQSAAASRALTDEARKLSDLSVRFRTMPGDNDPAQRHRAA